MIEANQLMKRYGDKIVVRDVSLSTKDGEFLGIIGPNGCGKSTLMKLLSGAERPDQGTVKINGRLLSNYQSKDLAKMLAVLQQESIPGVGFTVREMVEMGRYPYQNWLGEEKDQAFHYIMDNIMEKLEIKHLKDQTIDHLSGGERQRVAMGMVMAQEPTILMLDEPTTYLDIGHQLQIMDIIKGWQQNSGITVVVILHDLNIASMYCDRLIMMKQGQFEKVGSPSEVIEEQLVASIYETKPIITNHPKNTGVPQIILNPFSQTK